MFNPADMAARGRIGGYSRAAKYRPDELTGAARSGFMRRFYKDLPEGLTEQERARRAECALRAHMCALARKSVVSRSKRSGKRNHNREVYACENMTSLKTSP